MTAVAVVGLAGTACSSEEAADDPTTTEEPSTTEPETTTTLEPVVNSGASVEIIDFDYLARSVTVEAGQSITWMNSSGNRHSVTSEDGRFESSSAIQQSQSFVQAFPEPGTYNYYCTFHPELMRGSVTVQ